jgi:hypothetical protein
MRRVRSVGIVRLLTAGHGVLFCLFLYTKSKVMAPCCEETHQHVVSKMSDMNYYNNQPTFTYVAKCYHGITLPESM